MKKGLYAILAVFAVLAGAILACPLLFDVNQYKPLIEAQTKAATGYEISLKGELKLSLLPRPHVSVRDVSLFNNSKNFAKIEEISAYPEIKALFSRKVQINSLKVKNLVLTLERTEAGDNWTSQGGKGTVTTNEKFDLNVKEVQVENGKIDYSDKLENKTYSFNNINIKTGVPSLAGPVSFDGDVKYKDLPMILKGKIFYSDAFKISLNAAILGSEIFYEGSSNYGSFSVKSADIQPLADAFELDEFKQWAKLELNIKGDISRAKDKFDLENLDFTIGETKGEGDLSMAFDDKIEANADLSFTRINLDQLIPKIKSKEPEKEGDKTQKDISADLNITSEAVVYGGVVYKNLDIKASTETNVVNLHNLKFDFPTTGGVEITGELKRDNIGRVFEGHINSESGNFRDILQSFKFNLARVKPDVLNNFMLDSEIVVNIRDNLSVELSETDLQIDEEKFKGNISADLIKLPFVDINGVITGINLDKYLVTEKVPEKTNKQRETGATDDKPYRITWLEELPISGSVDVLVGKLTYNGDEYSGKENNGLRLKAKFKPETIDIGLISLSGRKMQFSAQGSIYAYPRKKPKFDIKQANIGKIDLADFIKPDAAPATKLEGKERWDKKPYDLSFIRRMDLDFEGVIQSLTHRQLVFNDLSLKFYIENGKLVVDNKSKCSFFGGKLFLGGSVEATAVPAIAIAYSGDNVEIGKLLEALIGNTRVSGKINFSGSVKSSGIYQLAMINNLGGTFTLAARNLVVRGFDVDGMAGQVVNTNNIADVTNIARTVSGDEAVTYLKSVNGGLGLENGIVRLAGQGMNMQVASGAGNYKGGGNLVNWTMDSNAWFKLVMPDGKTPAAGIHIFGPPDDPKKELNLDEIKRYLASRGAKQLLNDTPPPATTPALEPNAAPDPTQPMTKAEARRAIMLQRAAIARAKRAGWQQPVQR